MNDNKGLYEQWLGSVKGIAESGKWDTYLKTPDGGELGGWKRHLTAIMLEQTSTYLGNLSEDFRSFHIGSYAKYALPIVRSVIPNLVATEIVSVQPMPGPVSLVFYLDFIYGSTKGSITKGDVAFGSRGGHPNTDSTYSSEEIDLETPAGFVGTGGVLTFTGNLSYFPVQPGTVKGTTVIAGATIDFEDDQNGGFVGTKIDAAATNTINYSTGAITVTFEANVDASADISFNYFYNSEGNANVPLLDMVLSSVPVVARPRKLRTRWSAEAQQDFSNIHGGDAETELVGAVAQQLRREIDRDIIQDLFDIADGTSVDPFDVTPPAGTDYLTHKMNITDKFIEASGVIHRKTKQQIGTKIILGEMAANVVESLPTFKGQDFRGNGVIFLGRLNNRFDIYRDPDVAQDEYLVAAKDDESILKAGYAYLPYVPFYTTATYELDDMLHRKGFMTRDAKKVINKNYYVKGKIVKT